MNFQHYPGGQGNPLGFGFGKSYGAGGEESPHRRMRRLATSGMRLPPVERSVTPPQGRFGSASGGPAPSPMRASQLGSNMAALGGGGGGGGPASGYTSLDSSFASQASGGGGGGPGLDLAQVMRFVEARLSMEQSLREGVMREVGKLRDTVVGLERERDEARGAAEHLRGRQAMLAQELGLLRDRVESGGLRSEVATLHARLEMLQREMGHVAAQAQQGGGGGPRRDVLALVEGEARARQAAEEALSSRLLALHRSVTELQAAAAAAAAAAAVSPRGRGSGSGSGSGSDENALDVRTVVTKPVLETYLSGIRSAIEGEGLARRREGERLEAHFAAALDRAGAQIAGLRGGLQEEFGGRVETVVAAVTGAVSDLSARSREHAGALADHAASLAGLAGGLEEDRRGVREALGALREGLSRRADAGEAALNAQASAWARKEAALGDALLRGLQREEAARAGAVAQLAASDGALAERLEELRRLAEGGVARASGAVEGMRRSLEGALDSRLGALAEEVEGKLGGERVARGFGLKRLEEEVERVRGEVAGEREAAAGAAGDAVGRLSSELGALGARLGEEARARAAAVEGLEAAVAEGREAVGGRLRVCEGALEGLSAADGALAERLEELSASLAASKELLSSQVESKTGEITKSLETWQDSMSGEVSAAFDKINLKVKANVEAIGGLGSELERVRAEAEGRKVTLDELTRSMGALRASQSASAPALQHVEALLGEVSAMQQRIHSMEASVASVGDKLGSVAEAVGSSAGAGAGMAAGLEELRASASAQKEAVAGMQRGMAGLEAARLEAAGKLESLSAGLEGVKAHMGESEAGLSAAVAELRAKAEGSAAAEVGMAEALGKLQGSAASSASALAALSGSLEALKGEGAAAAAEGARALAEQLGALKAEAAAKQADLAAVQAGLAAMGAKSKATEEAVAALERGLGAAQAAAAQPGEAFAALNSTVSGLVEGARAREGAVASLSASLESLQAAAAARAATVERVEKELAGLAGEARTGLAELRGEASAHSGSVAELKAHLAGLNASLDAAKGGDAEAVARVQAELAAIGGRMSSIEGGVGDFSSRLGKEVAELRSGAGDNAALKAQLDALKAQSDKTSREVAETAQELASLRDKAAPPSVTGAAALEADAIVGVVNEAIRPEMGKLGARVKAVEGNVKSFSEKLGHDVEVWQAAVNAELQAALAKVKEQLKLHGEEVDALKRGHESAGAALGASSAAEKEAVAKRLKGVEEQAKKFSDKLGADVEAWQKSMNAELQSTLGKVRESSKGTQEEVARLAEEVGALKAGGGGGGGGGGSGGAAAGEVATMGKKIKAVEESVKSFSTKLGGDVEAWQQAINTELQAALTKVKEQVHRNAEVVGKCQRDVEAMAAGRPPSAAKAGGKEGEAAAAGGGSDAAVVAAMGKRIKVLEATLSAHEMALQAHTETLEAHASWLENIDSGFEDAPAEGGGEGSAAAPSAAAPKKAEELL